MQLVSLGVFSKDGIRRDVPFKLGSLNILTGRSRTGKSAILDIVEFCLGRETVTIPDGVISEHASWYYLIVQFEDERVLLCRPHPETASTNRAMIKFGGLDLGPPEMNQLEVNADTTVIRDSLSERLGIEEFRIEPTGTSLRSSFEVSIRQALFMCFQFQGEIASRDLLFHRQSDKDIKVAIRDTLPYFLGVSTPEQARIRYQLLTARRNLQSLQRQLTSAESDVDDRELRVAKLLESAAVLGILDGTDLTSGAPTRTLMETILSYRPADEAFSVEGELSTRRSELREEGRILRNRVREADDRIELLSRLQDEQEGSDIEAVFQRDRLRALDLLLPKPTGVEHQAAACPLCDQGLQSPDESISELRLLLEGLNQRLSSSRTSGARRQAAVGRVEELREELLAALRQNAVELDALAQQEFQAADGRQVRERIAFLQGQVSQESTNGVSAADDIGVLRDKERLARGRVAKFEQEFDEVDPAAALRVAMDSLSETMTDFARELDLEGSSNPVRLNPVELTIEVQRPGGRVPLSRLGSAANLIGYHLVTHLALHSWFATHSRPVPRFVMFDQPTQAFFPEEVVDATDDEDADWDAVRRQFAFLQNVVASLKGELQVIVCDHANLAESWFQDAVIENWRNGVALIPSSWILDE